MSEKKILEVAKEIARNTGKLLMDYYGKTHNVNHKSDSSIVTEADLVADRFIKKKIKEKFPQHSILSEESGRENHDSEIIWVIDPLDGTTNFSIYNPFFGVSIGVVRHEEPFIGVVYAPIQDELFYAQTGRGSMLNGKKIVVDNTKELDKDFISFCNGRDHKSRLQVTAIYRELKLKNNLIRQVGAAALELCYVAAGRTGGFFLPGVNAWDVMAGTLIVKEAGGIITDFSNNKFTIKAKNLIAAPEVVHHDLQTSIRHILDL
ncbi:MAG: inositol monophosphatase family protein [Candidatus Hodarchaeales archaeon]